MESRALGPLSVSVVGLGCNNFGRRMDIEASSIVVNAAIDAGITLFDTADVYGGEGRSEQFLGKALGARRDQIVLATKFAAPMGEDKQGASPTYIREAVEDSLRRLDTDRIDLYQQHRPDPQTPIAETLAALDELVQSGKVRYIGSSNFTAEMIREADSSALGAKFVSVQNEYSLLEREPENGVLDACSALGIGFLPFFPLASGLLTGKYRKGQPQPEGARLTGQEGNKFMAEANLEIVEQLALFVEARGRTMTELAFSWLLTRPAVSSVIAGATKVEQITDNVRAAGWDLTVEDLAELDRILLRG